MEARANLAADQRLHLSIGEKGFLAVGCVCAGVVPLAARWIFPDPAPRVAYGLLVAAAYLALSLLARRAASLRPYWELSFAFFILATVQVLNNALPPYVGTAILRDPPNAGNPLASTLSGTIVIQLLETLIAVVPVIAFTRLSGSDLGSIYVRRGKIGAWLAVTIGFFVLFYLFLATLPLRPDSPAHRLLPANGTLTLDRFLALTPALLILAFSNSFEEEFLFRGLFLQKYTAVFGFGAANVVQALVFAIAHAGITYTPTALLFIVGVVFPVGLITGYLMRATNGVLAPGVFHAAFDLAIYLAFLSYV